jgi:hypothetical protein
LGSLGDVNPFIGLGLALKERGHDVVIITNSYFEPIVKQIGLGFASCGPAQAYVDACHHPDGWHPEKAWLCFAASVWAPSARISPGSRKLHQPDNTIMALPDLRPSRQESRKKVLVSR